MLVIEGDNISHHNINDLPANLDKDSLVVVNAAATIPASFFGYVGSLPVELRLVKNLRLSKNDVRTWQALLFYKGNWRISTEERFDPDFIEVNDYIKIEDLIAEIITIDHPSKRLISLEFQGSSASIWSKLYKYGNPIQYSHLTEKLNLWDVQTIFSSLPIAIEPPSAAFQLRWDLIDALIKKGIEVVSINHATSISSTGNNEIDKMIPFPENYWISDTTAKTINRYLNQDDPIIAVGTSVTRALEDNYSKDGLIQSGAYTTDLIIDQNYNREVVDGLFTGMHLPEETHIKLLRNFINPELLEEAYQQAIELEYLWHEYGDVSLVLST